LFASGVAALLARLAPRTAPLWPDVGVLSQAIPAAGALLNGAAALVTIAVALFLLLVFERISAQWRRRRWLVGLLLIAALVATGLTAVDPVASVARSIAAGLALLAVVLGLLRYEPLAVPAFIATDTALTFIESALRGGWPAAPVHALLEVLAAGAVAWLATRYLAAARTSAQVAATSPSPRTE
jgi:hypothetical protein